MNEYQPVDLKKKVPAAPVETEKKDDYEEEDEKEFSPADAYGLDEQKILTQIDSEANSGEEYIRTRRDTKLKERSLYVQEAKKDKVNIHSIYLQMQVLMAMYYMDETVVKFNGRSIFTEEFGDRVSKVAEYDYEQMGMETIDYDTEFDRFYTGLGVRMLEGWNDITNSPYACHIDTLCTIPDPEGWYRAKDHRFYWFELQMSKEEMKRKFGEEVAEKATETRSAEEQKRQSAWARARGYNTSGSGEHEKHTVYWHFTIIDGYKYLTASANSRGVLLGIYKLEPETDEEKKDPLLVPWPFSLKYFSPNPHDYYGVSVPDLLKDKQTRFSKLFNLEYTRALRDSFGDDVFYNPEKVKNTLDLKTPSVEGRWIEMNVEPGENVAGQFWTAPKSQPNTKADVMMSRLEQESTKSIGIDPMSAGIGGDQNRTLGESQMIQQNANIRFGLITKISKWWDIDFWKVYYRSLQYNLKGEKIVRLTRSIGDYYTTFKRDDIVGGASLDIKIMTKSELKQMREKEMTAFFATYAADLADAQKQYQKNYLKRKKYRLQGWESEEIRLVVGETADETIAKADVERMNYGLEPLPVEDGQEHDLFMGMYELAIESEIKRKAIEKRKTAKLLLAQESYNMQANQAMQDSQANSSAAIVSSSAINKMNQNQKATGNNPSPVPA